MPRGRPKGSLNKSPLKRGPKPLTEISREFTPENIKFLAARRFSLKEIAAFFNTSVTTLYNSAGMIDAYHAGANSLVHAVNSKIIEMAMKGNVSILKHLDERLHGKVAEVVHVEDLRTELVEQVTDADLLTELRDTNNQSLH